MSRHHKRSCWFGLLTLGGLSLGALPVSAYVFTSVVDQEGATRQCDDEDDYGIVAPNVMMFMDRSASMLEGSGLGGGPTSTTTNILTAGEKDAGVVNVLANAPGNAQGRPAISLSNKVEIPAFVWAVNTGDGTVSKINADTNTEAGRYLVGGNPSRTAGDLDANVWVGDRNQGWLTKILANDDSCYDRNGNGVIDTSSGTNVLPPGQDECIAYHNRPAGGGNIRGLAAGPDGKMWIGYSNLDGGIQSIDVATFQTSPVITATSIPRIVRNNATQAYTQIDGTMGACGVYGMVLDSDGLLYLSSNCGDRMPVYNTQTNAWIGAYHFDPGGLYGIAVDGQKRVWMGGWSGVNGVRMFDPVTKRAHIFPTPTGASVTGVSVEPETGHVWAVFYNPEGRIGRLQVNESNLAASTWSTLQTNTGHGGIGFDNSGKAWVLGWSRKEPAKVNPATFTIEAVPNITSTWHYTYSDFTGSTARAFTAPSGRWRHAFDVQNRQVLALKVEAHVPADTSIGVRFRALDANGNATTGWYPPEINGSAQFFPYNPGSATVTIPVPQGNDNPFVAAQLDVDVRLGTEVTGTRPFLYDVEVLYDASVSAFQNAQALVGDLSNMAAVSGACTPTDSRGCDYLRVGLAYFSDTYQQVTTPGEDRNLLIGPSVASASADGLTDMALVAQRIATMPELRDPNRQNFALLVTDGKANTVATVTQALTHLCASSQRAVAPVQTYTMALGLTANFNLNSMLAAAGGTGHCCAGNSAACAPAQRIDVCTANMTTYLNQSGSGQFTQANTQNITCSGGLTAQDTLAFKLQLINYAREASSTFVAKLPNDPQMYNNPSAPQQGFLSDPDATRVIMHHGAWGATRLPFCDPNQGMTSCGLAQTLQQEKGITAPATLNAFRDEGWYFATTPNNRSVVRLTQNLADEMAGRRVRRVTMQAACQCFKPEGDPCIVAGFEDQPRSRCAAGVYSCNAQAFDICTPLFRPMPEICNGLDDSCDGKVDNLRESREVWTDQGGLPSAYRGATCGYRDICVCSSGLKRHLGEGDTYELEREAYLSQSFASDDLCVCGEGITPEDLEVWDSGASSEGGYDAIPDAQQVGGCSSSAGGSSSATLLFLGLGLVGARRKRSRRVA